MIPGSTCVDVHIFQGLILSLDLFLVVLLTYSHMLCMTCFSAVSIEPTLLLSRRRWNGYRRFSYAHFSASCQPTCIWVLAADIQGGPALLNTYMNLFHIVCWTGPRQARNNPRWDLKWGKPLHGEECQWEIEGDLELSVINQSSHAQLIYDKPEKSGRRTRFEEQGPSVASIVS